MKIPEDIQQKIKRDIKENVQWVDNGKLIEIPEGSMSTIMAIIRIRLEEVS